MYYFDAKHSALKFDVTLLAIIYGVGVVLSMWLAKSTAELFHMNLLGFAGLVIALSSYTS